MNPYWWLLAICLIVTFHYALRVGTKFVHKYTGRENTPGKKTTGFDAVFFGLTFAIAIPPIYLIPQANPLVIAAFMLLGLLIGILASQALYGCKRDQ